MAQADVSSFSSTFNGPEGQEDMPWLMTAGPVTTSRDVKFAMLADWSVRDAEFISMTLRVCEQLLEVASAEQTHDCIPLDMSGAAALECVVSAFAPTGRKRKTLIAAHGPHARQCFDILSHIKRPVELIGGSELAPVTAKRLQNRLAADPDIKTVYLLEMDIGSGLTNPVAELAEVSQQSGCKVILDTRASFGALPAGPGLRNVDATVGVPWMCLEGVAGFSFIMVRRELLGEGFMASPSHALDLFELWNGIHRTGRFPGTPPAHSIAACGAALRELYLEGGPEMRLRRYHGAHKRLLAGMKKLGFQPVLSEDVSTCGYFTLFQPPADGHFEITGFLQRLRQKGFVIWDGQGCPGPAGGFRIGTMGAIDEAVVAQFLAALERVMREMGLRSGAPAK